MLLSSCAEVGNSGSDDGSTSAPATTTYAPTNAPIYSAPSETKAPETNAPETKAPEATTPETTAPETIDPVLDALLNVKVNFKKADFYIFSTDVVQQVDYPGFAKLPENFSDYVFVFSSIGVNSNAYSDGCLSYEFPLTEYLEYKKADGTISSGATDCSKAGIIDSKEKLSEAIEKGTKKKYSELYTDDFFEKNIIIYISKYHSGSVFYEFEYGFDPETKLLAIHFTQPVKDMFLHSEMLHTYDYYITIPKEAITVNGKMIPYEELNFRFTGYDDK
jgi:hypothetical protein